MGEHEVGEGDDVQMRWRLSFVKWTPSFGPKGTETKEVFASWVWG
jgi:hypothetical protein